MTFEVDEELKSICQEICSEGLNEVEWSLIESSDSFQSVKYRGGYDTTESAFCFSRYTSNGEEFWFQFTLEQAKNVLLGKVRHFEARPAEKGLNRIG